MENNNIVIYENQNGVQVEVKLEQETVWLTQAQIIALFQSSKANISEHIKRIIGDEELDEVSTVRNFRTVQTEGSRTVSRDMAHYNLDMVIAVGYRVNSKAATAFRRWATGVLKQYMIQGYAVNERRLAEYKDKFKALQQVVSVYSPLPPLGAKGWMRAVRRADGVAGGPFHYPARLWRAPLRQRRGITNASS
jgi:hypothetical protein